MELPEVKTLAYYRFLVQDRTIPVTVRASAFASLESIYHAHPYEANDSRGNAWFHFEEFNAEHLNETLRLYEAHIKDVCRLVPSWSWKGNYQPPLPIKADLFGKMDEKRAINLVWERYQITLLLMEAFSSDEEPIQHVAYHVWAGLTRPESMMIKNRGHIDILPFIIGQYKTSEYLREAAIEALSEWVSSSSDAEYRKKVMGNLIRAALAPKKEVIEEVSNE